MEKEVLERISVNLKVFHSKLAKNSQSDIFLCSHTFGDVALQSIVSHRSSSPLFHVFPCVTKKILRRLWARVERSRNGRQGGCLLPPFNKYTHTFCLTMHLLYAKYIIGYEFIF